LSVLQDFLLITDTESISASARGRVNDRDFLLEHFSVIPAVIASKGAGVVIFFRILAWFLGCPIRQVLSSGEVIEFEVFSKLLAIWPRDTAPDLSYAAVPSWSRAWGLVYSRPRGSNSLTILALTLLTGERIWVIAALHPTDTQEEVGINPGLFFSFEGCLSMEFSYLIGCDVGTSD
jgi:hypothetical protein